MIWTLVATAAGSFASAAVYAALARMLWHREGDADARAASRSFARYWGFTAGYQAMVGAQHLAGAAGYAPFELTLLVRYVGLTLASVAIAGLMGFFAYLLTGDRRWLARLTVVYALVASLSWLHVWRSAPTGVAQTAWSVDLAYAGDFTGGLFLPLAVMLQLAPLGAAVWYATLARTVSDPRQRYRVLAVGVGVALQLLGFVLARLTESPLWQLVSRTILAFVVSSLVFSAYFALGGPATRAASPIRH